MQNEGKLTLFYLFYNVTNGLTYFKDRTNLNHLGKGFKKWPTERK